MIETNQTPVRITPSFYRLGTPAFPAYLSLGDVGMIIEGGTGPTFKIILKQIEALGIDPQQIEYVALTHTHADHIGAVPHLKLVWPHIKLMASSSGADILGNEAVVKEFLFVDNSIAKIMKSKGEIREFPANLDRYEFKVDHIASEGDRIDLGKGIVWHIHETPGHSPCHIALFEEKEETLALGDTCGFYVPEKDVFWPNYFDSLEKYVQSILSLSDLSAKRGALSHNYVVDGDLNEHYKKALKATETYHNEMMKRIGEGEDKEELALEKAHFVDSITDIQPFKVMQHLCKVLIKKSLEYGKTDEFGLETKAPLPGLKKVGVGE